MSDANSKPTNFGTPESDPLANDPELRKELAAMFLEDGPQQLAAVRAAMTNHDAPALKETAHKLKGSVGVFRDQAAFEAALRMEHIGRDAEWPAAEAAWQVLNQEVARLTTIVAEIAAKDVSAASGGTSA